MQEAIPSCMHGHLIRQGWASGVRVYNMQRQRIMNRRSITHLLLLHSPKVTQLNFPLTKSLLPSIMLLWEGKKPIILLLGKVIIVHGEWNDLGALADLRVRRLWKTQLAER